MGSGISSAHASDVLQSYGSLTLLKTLGEGLSKGMFEGLFDPTIPSFHSLLSLAPSELYIHSHTLCDDALLHNPTTKGVCRYLYYTIELILRASNTERRFSSEKESFLAFVVFHARLLLQSLIEKSSSQEIQSQLTMKMRKFNDGRPEEDICIAFPLLHAVVLYIVNTAKHVNGSNFFVYMEVVKLLWTLLATELVQKEEPKTNPSFSASPSASSASPSSNLFLSILMLPKKTQRSLYGGYVDAEKLFSVLFDHIVARRRYDPLSQSSLSNANGKGGTASDRASGSGTSGDYPLSDLSGSSTASTQANNVDLEGGQVEMDEEGNATDMEEKESAWSAFVELGRFFVFPFQEIARIFISGDSQGATAAPIAPLAELCIFPFLILLSFHNGDVTEANNHVIDTLDGKLGAEMSRNPYRNIMANLNQNGTLSREDGIVAYYDEDEEEEVVLGVQDGGNAKERNEGEVDDIFFYASISGSKLAQKSRKGGTKSNTSNEASSSSSNSNSTLHKSGEVEVKFPTYQKIYQMILNRIGEDVTIIMLYEMIQTNNGFRIFLSSKADLDHLIMPLLATLYRAHESTRLRVYTILIIMTVLSSDLPFIESINSISIQTPHWFKERYIRSVPLPEFISLVLLRTIYLNMRGMRDSYLFENCLACLSNLAPQLHNLSLYTSKRILFLSNLFIKKYLLMMMKNKKSILASPRSHHDQTEPPQTDTDSDDELGDPSDLSSYNLSELRGASHLLPPPSLPAEPSSSSSQSQRQLSSTSPPKTYPNPSSKGTNSQNSAISVSGSSSTPSEANQASSSSASVSIPIPSHGNQGEGHYDDLDENTHSGDHSFQEEEDYASYRGIELMKRLDETEGQIKTFLEIIDCLLRKKPSQNVQMIYALILDTGLFDGLESHPRLSELVNHLKSCSETYLRIVQSEECNTPPQVIQTLSKASLQWKKHATEEDFTFPLPDLHFAFLETNASQFFSPSIWKSSLKSPFFYWNPDFIGLYQIFPAGSDPSFSGDDLPDGPTRYIVPEHL
jgi:hypothetical protein